MNRLFGTKKAPAPAPKPAPVVEEKQIDLIEQQQKVIKQKKTLKKISQNNPIFRSKTE